MLPPITLPAAAPGFSRAATSRLRYRTVSLLCGACLACSVVPVFAVDLSADTADALPLTTSLTQALIAPPPLLADAATSLAAPPRAVRARVQRVVDERVQSVLERALSLVGIPYRWGGTSPERGFDCSGLVKYVFSTALGIDLPRVSREQARNGQLVERSALVAGDLVFFSVRRRGPGINHVGIYLGDGRFIHAPRTGKDVMVSTLNGYWSQRFARARRVLGW